MSKKYVDYETESWNWTLEDIRLLAYIYNEPITEDSESKPKVN